MPELRLHGREVRTVFDLLGEKENDLTYALGWALAHSERLLVSLLADVLGADAGEPSAVRLQEYGGADGGFTDIEIETNKRRVVLEAKRGWDLPGLGQLKKYVPRLRTLGGAILVVSECMPSYAAYRLPKEIGGIPVVFRRWQSFTSAAEGAAQDAGNIEKRLLAEFVRYLKGLMTMQNVDSTLVYVVSLSTNLFEGSDLHFDTVVMEKDRYFHPVGGTGGGWPKEPPNYLGFRFHGKLQRVSHVEDYTIVTRPHDEIPEIHDYVDWSDRPHFIYRLGPHIAPSREVRTGKLFRGQRVWTALDLLLTCETISEARDKTRERYEAAGAA